MSLLLTRRSSRLNYTKTREIRDLVTQLLAQFAKLTAFLLTLDIRNLSQGTVTEESYAGLTSPPYLRTLSALPGVEDPYFTNGVERNPNPLDPLEMFQSSYDISLAAIVSFIELHMAALAQFPRTIMDNLTAACAITHAIARESIQKQLYPIGITLHILERSRTTLALGYKCFALLSDAIQTVMEKSINHLSQEVASGFTFYLSETLKYTLQSNNPETLQHTKQYRLEHHNISAKRLQWNGALVSTVD